VSPGCYGPEITCFPTSKTKTAPNSGGRCEILVVIGGFEPPTSAL
jgi:hypothetical protein